MSDVAQYAIQVATELTNPEKSAAALQALEAALHRTGNQSTLFAQTQDAASLALKEAKKFQDATTESLKAGSDQYAQLERVANRTATAVEKAAQKGAVPESVTEAAKKAAAALQAYTPELKKLEDASAAANAEAAKMSHALEKVNRAGAKVRAEQAQASAVMGKYQQVLSGSGGPIGRLTAQLIAKKKAYSELSAQVGTTRAATMMFAAGTVAVTAAAVVAAAAVASATIAATAYAIKLADTARESKLSRDAFNALHPELAATTANFSAITRATGVAEDRLYGLTKSLKEAKVSSAQMPAALRAMATAEAALGKGGADQFIAQLATAKKTVSGLSKEIDAKLGNIAARRMLGLSASGDRLKSNLAGIFGGLKIEGALRGIERFVQMFDATSAIGKTLKWAFEGVFQPLMDRAESAAIAIEAFTLGAANQMLKMAIAFKEPLRRAKEALGFGKEGDQASSVLDQVEKAGKYAAIALGVCAGAFIAVEYAVIKFWGAVYKSTEAVVSFGASVYNAVPKARDQIVNAFNEAKKALSAFPEWAAGLGKDIILGAARGITGAAGNLVGAIKNVFTDSSKEADRVLGRASPSKVFATKGADTVKGYVVGVRKHEHEAQSALERVVTYDDRRPGDQPGMTSVDASRSSSSTIGANFAGAQFIFHGVRDAAHAAELFEDALTRVLGGDAAAMGGAS